MAYNHRPQPDFHEINFLALAMDCGAKSYHPPLLQGSAGVCMTLEQLRTFAAFVLMGSTPVDIPTLTDVLDDDGEPAEFSMTEVMVYPAD